jgi:hypothetical protein
MMLRRRGNGARLPNLRALGTIRPIKAARGYQ